MVTQVKIKDTGLDKVGGFVIYPQVNSGAWIETNSTRINFEFNTITTNNEATLSDDNNNLTFASNEVSGVISPRFNTTILVKATDTTKLQQIIMLGRSKGVKRLTGGIALISALPEAEVDGTDSYVSVIIKNITPTELASKDVEYVQFTIQMEQVR